VFHCAPYLGYSETNAAYFFYLEFGALEIYPDLHYITFMNDKKVCHVCQYEENSFTLLHTRLQRKIYFPFHCTPTSPTCCLHHQGDGPVLDTYIHQDPTRSVPALLITWYKICRATFRWWLSSLRERWNRWQIEGEVAWQHVILNEWIVPFLATFA
jgi:hypothetical protein